MEGKTDSFIGHVSRHRHLLDDFVDHVVGAQAVGVGFVTQGEPVSQAVMHDCTCVVGSDVIAAVQPGVGAAYLVEGERAA
jgi:hypothetical protein